MVFDYSTLKIIWWLILGVLLIGFAIMDGHDMGVATLLPFAGRSDIERRVIINTIGPHWEGNQVWFITGGGAIFAAWPLVYATAFSGFYWAMLAVLWALFLRPVGFDYRSKIETMLWRRLWDWGLFVGGSVPPLIFGVAFGNLLQGVPFQFDSMMISTYTGNFWQLLNPFALLAGVVSSSMVILQGGVYLAHRTEQDIQRRAIVGAQWSALVMIATFVAAGLWLRFGGIEGYVVTSSIDSSGVADPLAKVVVRATGGWWNNYHDHSVLWLVPAMGITGAALAVLLLRNKRTGLAFIASSLGVASVIATVGCAMFPFLMPSSSMPDASLTIWDSVSSRRTLGLMFWVTVILMPLVLIYTGWAYRIMRGKVTVDRIRASEHSSY